MVDSILLFILEAARALWALADVIFVLSILIWMLFNLEEW
jgi:hypothetical protein